MKYQFRYHGNLIVVPVTIYGNNPTVPSKIFLALDTGSTKTIIQPANIELLGYSEKDKTKNVGITTGSKTEKGYELKIGHLHCLGCEWDKPNIIVKQLPLSLYYIDGLLGLDFFQAINKKLTIDFGNTEIQID
jgi:hypothetical protein